MQKNRDFSEKERVLREIFESARLFAGKRGFCKELGSELNVEKGGFE